MGDGADGGWAECPALKERLFRVETGQKGKRVQGQICRSGSPCLPHRGTGVPGGVHRTWMGHRGSWEFNCQDQPAGKESSSQVWTNLRSGFWGLQERDARKMASSLAGGLQDNRTEG